MKGGIQGQMINKRSNEETIVNINKCYLESEVIKQGERWKTFNTSSDIPALLKHSILPKIIKILKQDSWEILDF